MNRVSILCLVAASLASGQQVVHYQLKMQELKTVYGNVPPVMHVKPGDTIDTTTVDADGKEPAAAGYKVNGPNPLTGPFYIDGAEPGDTLAVKFLSIETNAKEGFGSAGPGFGALNSTNYTPVLGGHIPKLEWPYVIDKAANVATFQAKDSKFSVKIPLHPFLGCVELLRPRENRAVPSFPPSSEATWMLPKRVPATRCICP
jgi:amidase